MPGSRKKSRRIRIPPFFLAMPVLAPVLVRALDSRRSEGCGLLEEEVPVEAKEAVSADGGARSSTATWGGSWMRCSPSGGEEHVRQFKDGVRNRPNVVQLLERGTVSRAEDSAGA